MSQFAEIVKNIALESEKCGYNPEFHKNWSFFDNFLEERLRDKCIKLMDTKTKVRLSETNSFYKGLAEDHILKLDYIAENIALESKKCNYNPGKDMNWCNLPMEMRYECVKRMDFKTRCRFREVSKAEQSLVDSKKHKFMESEIWFVDEPIWNYHRWNVFARQESKSKATYVDVDTFEYPHYGCLSAILKHADVKRFSVWGQDSRGYCVDLLLEELVKLAPFRFQRLSVYLNPSLGSIIKNCVKLETVDFKGGFILESFSFPYKEILESPSILLIKKFQLANPEPADFIEFLSGLVQKWIDNDVEAGKSVQFEVDTGGIVNTFSEKFADRIIDKTDNEVRFRMDTATTQILLRSIGSRDSIPFQTIVTTEFGSCKVIPIDMPESEYSNGDGWAQTMFEKRLKKEGVLENPRQHDPENIGIW